MPHLSPLNWIITPLFFWLLLLVMSSTLWWQQTPQFPLSSASSRFLFTSWPWN